MKYKVKRAHLRDALTGLDRADAFYYETRKLLDAHQNEEFAVIRFDVERFKHFNNIYGRNAGDGFLVFIASRMRKFGEINSCCTYARIEADVFATCAKFTEYKELMDAIELLLQEVRNFNLQFDISMVFGIYIVDDRSLHVSEMLDRATLAAKSIKGQYDKNTALFTKEMGEQQHWEQVISNEMNRALEQNQFCVYYQPKYNMITEEVCGAEALVRWNHPERGFLSPGIFIPLFEKNGFVGKIDYFVWEKVCSDLRNWLDKGIPAHPVSVNVSRINLNNPDIGDTIDGLVKKYRLPCELFQLEITESAYMDNPEIMKTIVDDFHKKGYTVLMDDFGSGYSSLNTLKEIHVDILKIDMKFLPTGENNPKSEKILASMIRMVNWLGMPAIVEGVETLSQKEYLKSVGCMYAQGYYYSRPVPKDEYENLLIDSLGEKRMIPLEMLHSDKLDDMLSSDSAIVAVLSGLTLPVAIFEVIKDEFDCIRANQNYYDMIGYEISDKLLFHFLSDEDKEKVRRSFHDTVEIKNTTDCEVLFYGRSSTAKWLRMQMRHIMTGKNGDIILVTYIDITQEKRVVSEMSRIVSILRHSRENRQKLLVAGDSREIRQSFGDIFGEEYEIIEAVNGREAIDALKIYKDEVVLILLDSDMPEMDGVKFLEEKNYLEGGSDIPVIMVLSRQDREFQEQMLHSGVNDFVVRPLVPQVVKRRVGNVLDFQNRFEDMVMELRKSLSFSPTISKDMLESHMSVADIRAIISFLQPIFDVVRLVDPINTALLTFGEGDIVLREKYSCFKIWNKNVRCTSCTSLCAANEFCQTSKYEYIEDEVFYVISRPVEIYRENGEVIDGVLELASRVTDSHMIESVNGANLENSVETGRQKIYTDSLTLVHNRRYLYEMQFLKNIRESQTNEVGFVIIYLNELNKINYLYGHQRGDKILAAVAGKIKEVVGSGDSVIRFTGDKFLTVFTDCSRERLDFQAKMIREGIRLAIISEEMAEETSVGIGYTHCRSLQHTKDSLDREIAAANDNMRFEKA